MGEPGTAGARTDGASRPDPAGQRERARREPLPVIGALSELAAIVGEHEEVYLRHSLGPAADRHQSSRDYESGLELPGLSVVPLSPPQWWRRPVTDWLARQICKYAHLSQRDSRRYPWVLTGPVTGAGPDQEPLVADPLPLGRLSDQVLAEARQRYHERFQVGRESPD